MNVGKIQKTWLKRKQTHGIFTKEIKGRVGLLSHFAFFRTKFRKLLQK